MDKVSTKHLKTSSLALIWNYWKAYYEVLTMTDKLYESYLDYGRKMLVAEKGFVEGFEKIFCIHIDTDEMIAALAYLKKNYIEQIIFRQMHTATNK